MLILYNPCDILSTTALPEPALAGVFGNPSFLKSGGRASFQNPTNVHSIAAPVWVLVQVVRFFIDGRNENEKTGIFGVGAYSGYGLDCLWCI